MDINDFKPQNKKYLNNYIFSKVKALTIIGGPTTIL